MPNNPYSESASQFLQKCSSLIRVDIDDADIVQAILNFSIGMERLLKGVLYEINPTYVMVKPEFDHSVATLYGKSVLDNDGSRSMISKSPNADVITFRNSLLRSAVVSEVTLKHKNKLFGLSHLRDLIAHNDMALFDYEKAKALLQRDFYPILLDYIDELKLEKSHCFSENSEDSLIAISKIHKTDWRVSLRVRIEEHRRKWGRASRDAKALESKKIITEEILENEKIRHPTSCPACNQNAVLFSEPDYIFDIDGDQSSAVAIGQFVRKIQCFYCGFLVDDGNELDELGYGKSFKPYLDDDIPF